MVATDKLFVGSIPEIYDNLLVPLIFDPYASDLADRLVKLKPVHILETAAGTGALTRAVAARLPPSVEITATDLNQPMLDRAMSRTPDDIRISWEQADALALPYGDQSFDAVLCQFGVMFFPDRVQGYREARRVLRPGGHFLFTVWDRISENAFVNVINDTLAGVFRDNPTAFMTRTPHGYYDVEQISKELKAAGFTSVKTETVDHMAKGKTPLEVATAYCQGTPLRAEIEERGGAGLENVTRTVADALAKKFGTGPIEGAIRAHIISAAR
jgi:ubiquinone/menaquinone biosynthesis C-methylase UbiE